MDTSVIYLICLMYILYYFIFGVLLDITVLSNGSTNITLLLMREDTEKLCNHHTQNNKLKLITFHLLKVNTIYCIQNSFKRFLKLKKKHLVSLLKRKEKEKIYENT